MNNITILYSRMYIVGDGELIFKILFNWLCRNPFLLLFKENPHIFI